MKTLTISLSEKQLSTLHGAVESGSYASNSEVVRDALRLWEQRQELRDLELTRLKEAYASGMASGEGRTVNADTILSELKAESQSRG